MSITMKTSEWKLKGARPKELLLLTVQKAAKRFVKMVKGTITNALAHLSKMPFLLEVAAASTIFVAASSSFIISKFGDSRLSSPISTIRQLGFSTE